MAEMRSLGGGVVTAVRACVESDQEIEGASL